MTIAESKELAGRPIDEQTALGKKVRNNSQVAYDNVLTLLGFKVGEYTSGDTCRYAECHCHYGELSCTARCVFCDRYRGLSCLCFFLSNLCPQRKHAMLMEALALVKYDADKLDMKAPCKWTLNL